ncbi:helix-turn-helix domain-containing protein [uncultured Oscillibacter sp.]|jgi:transcriptional regulator with XRE-family HTH domain|uniref:helix-turn-helix domain-containing protein n=1 Tax=uncultured Oscillibacter sp. TaxID=876091 RepID=UPI002607BC36|nr:helix-turn-helix domain-containing protein [uncultured Oscillibacter sp.]
MGDKETCAKRIKEALQLRDMTQADLCRTTGIPKSAMSQYCNGGLVPRQDRTYLIATALNVSEAWLMGYNVSMERETAPASLEEDGRVGEFVGLFGQLTAEQQALIIAQIKGILSAQ